jgi:hypothetical protein
MFALGFRHKLTIELSSACFALLLVAGLTYLSLVRNNVDRQWVALS